MAVTSQIVVFEKRPRWLPELQRQFLGEDVRLTACRGMDDAEQLIPLSTVRVIILELAAAPAAILSSLQNMAGRSPQKAVFVVASQASWELEWAARELGAAAFVGDSITGEELASLCRRNGVGREVGL